MVRSVDGVLLHKSKPIEGATETLKYLQEHKIPFILLSTSLRFCHSSGILHVFYPHLPNYARYLLRSSRARC